MSHCQGFHVDALRRRDHELEAVTGQSVTRRAAAEQSRTLAVHLRIGGVGETEFDAGAELIPHRRSDVRPPRCGEDDVYPDRESLCGNRGDGLLHAVELLTCHRPPVDHQERVDTDPGIAGMSPNLSVTQEAMHVRDDSAGQIAVHSARHRSHVGQPSQRRQRATAEVQPVDLHRVRIVGGRQPQHQGAHGRRLPGARAADDRDVPARRSQIDQQRVATLRKGVVHQPDRDDEPRSDVPDFGEQSRERRRHVQRRKPYPVRRFTPIGQTVHHDVEECARTDGADVPAGRRFLVTCREATRDAASWPDLGRDRTRHERRLKSDEITGGRLEQSSSRCAGKLIGVCRPEYRA